MAAILTIPPNQEPVSLAELREHLRVLAHDDDGYILALELAARRHVELLLSRALCTQTWRLDLDRFPRGLIRLPIAPVASLVSITYRDAGGYEQTVDAADYVADLASEPARIAPAACWPATAASRLSAVSVTFTAGYGTPKQVPETLKAAIRLLVGHWYEHREAAMETPPQEVPFAVRSLLEMERWHGYLGEPEASASG